MSVPANTSMAAPNTLSHVVMDASVAIKWLVPEAANGLWRKWREKELSAEAVLEILTDFRRFPLHIHSAESLCDVAWTVAQGSDRTFYDSLYVALAVSAGCPLVTGGSPLMATGRSRRVSCARYTVPKAP